MYNVQAWDRNLNMLPCVSGIWTSLFCHGGLILGQFQLMTKLPAQLNFSGPEFVFAKFWEVLKKIIWQLI